MNCKDCGRKISKTNKFCPNCGAKIELQEQVKEIVEKEEIKEKVQEEVKEQINTQQTIETPKIEVKKPNGLLAGSIVVGILSLLSLNLFAVILSIIAIVYLCTYNEEKTSEQQQRKIGNGKIMSIIAWVLYGIGMIIRIGIIALIIIIANGIKKSDFNFDSIGDFIERYSNGEIRIDYNSNDIDYDDEDEYINNDVSNSYSYLTEINYDQLIELYNGTPKSIVVLVQTYCGYCNMYKPIINEIAKEKNITINYIDITKLSATEYNNLTSSIDYLVANPSTWGTPTTLIVSSGKTVGYLEGSTTKEATLSFYEEYSMIK